MHVFHKIAEKFFREYFYINNNKLILIIKYIQYMI